MKRRRSHLSDQNEPPPASASASQTPGPTSLRRSPRFLRRTSDSMTAPPSLRIRVQIVEEPAKLEKSRKGSSGVENLSSGSRRSRRLSVLAEKTPECDKKGKASVRSSARLRVPADKTQKRGKKEDRSRRSPSLSIEVMEMRKGVSKYEQNCPEVDQRCCVLGLAAGKEERRRRDATDHRSQVVEVKRDEVASGNKQGWTKEQAAALNRAYLVAKPTPSFWKQVAKLVPGKSAQECFDKVNSDLATPQPKTRTRAAEAGASQAELSPLSASKILVEPIQKASKRTKTKSHIVHRNLRKLLRKHTETDKTTGADLFSILEPNASPCINSLESSSKLSTPQTAGKMQGFLHNCQERSSSSKEPLSRFHNSAGAGEVLRSPPVLKPVKNRAMHEKYLDQLHCREAKRKLVSARNNLPAIPKVDVVRAAREALISDARDAIHSLRDLQDSPNCSSLDLSDDYGTNEDENDENIDVNVGI